MMADALDQGSSLILFPEGTRNTTDEPLLPFKSGLYHLARRRPDVELVPVWIENLNRVMPKGEFVPIPLLCTVTFGAPLDVGAGRGQGRFLRPQPRRAARARRRAAETRSMTASRADASLVRRHRRRAGGRLGRRLRAAPADRAAPARTRRSTTSTAASRPGG